MRLIPQPEVALSVQDNLIWVRCDLAHVPIMRALPGIKMIAGKFCLPLTPIDAWRLDKAFVSKLTLTAESQREQWTRLVDSHDMHLQQLSMEDAEFPPIPRTRVTPWSHQLRMFSQNGQNGNPSLSSHWWKYETTSRLVRSIGGPMRPGVSFSAAYHASFAMV